MSTSCLNQCPGLPPWQTSHLLAVEASSPGFWGGRGWGRHGWRLLRVTAEESWAGGPGPPGLLAPVPQNPAFALGFLLNPKFPEKVEGRFSAAPLVDLSLSPPSGLDSPNGSSSLSPERQGNGDLPTASAGPVRGRHAFSRWCTYLLGPLLQRTTNCVV